MDIQLRQLIIHELVKEADASEAQLFLTEDPMPLDERAEGLVGKINHTFLQKEELLQGYLASPSDGFFSGAFRQLAEAQFAGEAFLQFSRDTMQALRLALQGIVGAKGGYLVYADYEHFENRTIGIFLVRDMQGLIFQKDHTRSLFHLEPTTYLNTDRLAMACRILVDKYRDGQSRCVEVIKHARSQAAISEYFLNWLGLDQSESSRTFTETFLQVVDELPLLEDAETGQPMPADQFRSEVFNFAMSNPHKSISIPQFDAHFYGEEPQAQNYLSAHDVDLDPEFRFDRKTMKQLYHFRASAQGLNLSFTRDHLHDGQVIVEADTVTIHSPELAQRLLELLG